MQMNLQRYTAKTRLKPPGVYLSEAIFRVRAYSRGVCFIIYYILYYIILYYIILYYIILYYIILYYIILYYNILYCIIIFLLYIYLLFILFIYFLHYLFIIYLFIFCFIYLLFIYLFSLYLSEAILGLGLFEGGLRGGGLIQIYISGGLPNRKESERLSHILYKKLLEKTKALLYFVSNVNGDGIKEEKVAKTVIRIKCWHK